MQQLIDFYSKKGWYMIPLNGKIPIQQDWPNSCTLDVKQAAGWQNIGIVTGEKSGLLVVDVDPRHGGDDTLKDLEKQHGEINTARCLTGGGGVHLYFNYPKGLDIRNKANILPGIDIRANKGQVVAPPSMHESGKQYEWDAGYHPAETPLADCPAWLLDLIQEQPVKTHTGLITEGSRNAMLFKMGSSLRDRGLSANEILAALLTANTERCEPPLEMKEVKTIAKSTARYKPSQTFANQPIIKKMSEIAPKIQNFLIAPYIPADTFTIFAGQPGSTKTWFSLYLAALISNGNEFITDEENLIYNRQPRLVIYQSKENDYPTVVRPRLDRLGANLDNIFMITDKDEDGNGISLTLTDGTLEKVIAQYRPALVILDPLQSYLGENVDMHRANEVRPVLDKIMEYSTTYSCAIIIIMHLSKMATMGALDRILGSMDFRAAARSICIIGNDPFDPKRRVLAHAKFNNGEYGQSIAYRITPRGLEIEGFCNLTEDEIVQSIKEGRDKPSVSLEEAKAFLKGEIASNQIVNAHILRELAEQQGINKSTLYSAKQALGIQHKLTNFGANKTSGWYFPDNPLAAVHSVPLLEIP